MRAADAQPQDIRRPARSRAIASAAFPKYGRNLNTGGDNNADTNYVTAHQRIFHDRGHAFYVTLPVMPDDRVR